ncbi:hypothetical protein LMG29660_03177 [Burkholderia puraquae]|uniref:Uncharacterized protein n=1 Tax=Burkholderia puraquae TaxID=1904757 RepID=A0A6J5DV51_9BURK|nr:hypothetical protein LMG29660_03177 [Burkholderia puraquae]
MRLSHRHLRLNTNLIWYCPRTASRLVRVAATVSVAQCLDMNSARRTGMNICGLTAQGRLAVAVRMRRSGHTTLRAVRMARRIRSILRCRNRKRGRSMTTVRGRSARLPAGRGRRGRLAISAGEAWFWAAATALPGALRDFVQRSRILRRCLLQLRDDQPARLNRDLSLSAPNKSSIVDQPHSTDLHVRIKRLISSPPSKC